MGYRQTPTNTNIIRMVAPMAPIYNLARTLVTSFTLPNLNYTMSAIFTVLRDILDGCREIRLLSDTHGYTPTGLGSSTTPQLHLHLPEVLAPAQFLIDMGFRPILAHQLSKTYMDFVAQFRKTCQSHFDHAARGGHLTEYYRNVFIVLFRRTAQAWDSRIVSIVRAQLCQTGALQATVRIERVDVNTIVISKATCDANPS